MVHKHHKANIAVLVIIVLFSVAIFTSPDYLKNKKDLTGQAYGDEESDPYHISQLNGKLNVYSSPNDGNLYVKYGQKTFQVLPQTGELVIPKSKEGIKLSTSAGFNTYKKENNVPQVGVIEDGKFKVKAGTGVQLNNNALKKSKLAATALSNINVEQLQAAGVLYGDEGVELNPPAAELVETVQGGLAKIQAAQADAEEAVANLGNPVTAATNLGDYTPPQTIDDPGQGLSLYYKKDSPFGHHIYEDRDGNAYYLDPKTGEVAYKSDAGKPNNIYKPIGDKKVDSVSASFIAGVIGKPVSIAQADPSEPSPTKGYVAAPEEPQQLVLKPGDIGVDLETLQEDLDGAIMVTAGHKKQFENPGISSNLPDAVQRNNGYIDELARLNDEVGILVKKLNNGLLVPEQKDSVQRELQDALDRVNQINENTARQTKEIGDVKNRLAAQQPRPGDTISALSGRSDIEPELTFKDEKKGLYMYDIKDPITGLDVPYVTDGTGFFLPNYPVYDPDANQFRVTDSNGMLTMPLGADGSIDYGMQENIYDKFSLLGGDEPKPTSGMGKGWKSFTNLFGADSKMPEPVERTILKTDMKTPDGLRVETIITPDGTPKYQAVDEFGWHMGYLDEGALVVSDGVDKRFTTVNGKTGFYTEAEINPVTLPKTAQSTLAQISKGVTGLGDAVVQDMADVAPQITAGTILTAMPPGPEISLGLGPAEEAVLQRYNLDDFEVNFGTGKVNGPGGNYQFNIDKGVFRKNGAFFDSGVSPELNEFLGILYDVNLKTKQLAPGDDVNKQYSTITAQEFMDRAKETEKWALEKRKEKQEEVLTDAVATQDLDVSGLENFNPDDYELQGTDAGKSGKGIVGKTGPGQEQQIDIESSESAVMVRDPLVKEPLGKISETAPEPGLSKTWDGTEKTVDMVEMSVYSPQEKFYVDKKGVLKRLDCLGPCNWASDNIDPDEPVVVNQETGKFEVGGVELPDNFANQLGNHPALSALQKEKQKVEQKLQQQKSLPIAFGELPLDLPADMLTASMREEADNKNIQYDRTKTEEASQQADLQQKKAQLKNLKEQQAELNDPKTMQSQIDELKNSIDRAEEALTVTQGVLKQQDSAFEGTISQLNQHTSQLQDNLKPIGSQLEDLNADYQEKSKATQALASDLAVLQQQQKENPTLVEFDDAIAEQQTKLDAAKAAESAAKNQRDAKFGEYDAAKKLADQAAVAAKEAKQAYAITVEGEDPNEVLGVVVEGKTVPVAPTEAIAVKTEQPDEATATVSSALGSGEQTSPGVAAPEPITVKTPVKQTSNVPTADGGSQSVELNCEGGSCTAKDSKTAESVELTPEVIKQANQDLEGRKLHVDEDGKLKEGKAPVPAADKKAAEETAAAEKEDTKKKAEEAMKKKQEAAEALASAAKSADNTPPKAITKPAAIAGVDSSGDLLACSEGTCEKGGDIKFQCNSLIGACDVKVLKDTKGTDGQLAKEWVDCTAENKCTVTEKDGKQVVTYNGEETPVDAKEEKDKINKQCADDMTATGCEGVSQFTQGVYNMMEQKFNGRIEGIFGTLFDKFTNNWFSKLENQFYSAVCQVDYFESTQEVDVIGGGTVSMPQYGVDPMAKYNKLLVKIITGEKEEINAGTTLNETTKKDEKHTITRYSFTITVANPALFKVYLLDTCNTPNVISYKIANDTMTGFMAQGSVANMKVLTEHYADDRTVFNCDVTHCDFNHVCIEFESKEKDKPRFCQPFENAEICDTPESPDFSLQKEGYATSSITPPEAAAEE